VDEARHAARSLSRFPRRGRIVPEVGDAAIREIFVKQYRMIYEISTTGIVMLAFLHGARQFPNELK
jgi:toxin ParE1/3/4